MSDTKRICFVGLGAMGGPMARHLAAAGHEVIVYNRGDERADAWLATDASGAIRVPTPAEGAQGADAVIACVGRDEDVEQVFLGGDGALAAMREGALLIDHTTVSAQLARRLAQAASAKNVHAVDAPVSGGQAGAENGALAIMCGGSDEALVLARPVMEAYAARIVHVGPAGAGQAAKMANQICIAGVLAGLSEAVRFTQAQDIDADKVFEAISGGAAQSWQMDNRWTSMMAGDFDHGFAIDWMRKDLKLALEEADMSRVPLTVTALVDQFYAELQAMGAGRQDTSALVRRIAQEGVNR